MKRGATFTAGAIAVGCGLWWGLPLQTKSGSIKLADIGPPYACGCVAAISPPIRAWNMCVTDTAIAENRLNDLVLEGEAYQPGAKSTAAFKQFVEIDAVKKCGTFEDAYGRAVALQKQRREADYDDYWIVETPEAMFAGQSEKGLRNLSKEFDQQGRPN